MATTRKNRLRDLNGNGSLDPIPIAAGKIEDIPLTVAERQAVQWLSLRQENLKREHQALEGEVNALSAGIAERCGFAVEEFGKTRTLDPQTFTIRPITLPKEAT